jgi:hypothetical protein
VAGTIVSANLAIAAPQLTGLPAVAGMAGRLSAIAASAATAEKEEAARGIRPVGSGRTG